MTIYAASDIHGHLDALEQALEKIDLSGDNRLIFLGDYIDGPASGQVLRRIFELQKAHGPEKVIVLRGNHEEMFLEWLDTYTGPKVGIPDEYGLIPWNDWLDTDRDFGTFRTLVTAEQFASFEAVLPTLSENTRNSKAAEMVLSTNSDLIQWLRNLPYFYETEKQIFVHAGIEEESGDWWRLGTAKSTFVGKFPADTGLFYKDIIAGHVGTSILLGDSKYHGVYHDGQSHYYIDGSIRKHGGQLNVLVYDTETEKYTWFSVGKPRKEPHDLLEDDNGV